MNAEHVYTPEEATAILIEVRPLANRVRDLGTRLLALRDEIEAIVARHGEAGVDRPENPDRDRYWNSVASFRELQEELELVVEELRVRGVEVKDLQRGLVDFYAKRGDELVFLCWKPDEETVRYWHPLDTGYPGRRPIEEF